MENNKIENDMDISIKILNMYKEKGFDLNRYDIILCNGFYWDFKEQKIKLKREL
jgi:hypothetical protein